MLAMSRIHILLRILASLLLVMVACLLGFNAQTETVFLITKKATFRDLNSLCVAMYVFPLAAGYNLLRVGTSSTIFSVWFQKKVKGLNLTSAWVGFLLDQIAVYLMFATTSRALQGSIMAITGQEDFQWMKLCNTFTRFCSQVGGALVCGYIACVFMILIASVSSFNLFRLYSPKRFLQLKTM